MRGNTWQFVALAIALALVVPAVNVAFADAASPFVANETTNIDYDVNYTLENDDAYDYTSLTVKDAGATLDEGDDYTFDESTATIDWLSSPDTTDGDEVTVNYTYDDHTQQTENQSDVLQTFGYWLGWLLLIGAVGTTLTWAFGGW